MREIGSAARVSSEGRRLDVTVGISSICCDKTGQRDENGEGEEHRSGLYPIRRTCLDQQDNAFDFPGRWIGTLFMADSPPGNWGVMKFSPRSILPSVRLANATPEVFGVNAEITHSLK